MQPARGLPALVWVALLTFLLPSGCGDGNGSGRVDVTGLPQATPILVFGADGFEWDIILPMLRQGRLPHVATLMERGSYGELETLSPTFSPAIWTTMATGKQPAEHGIDQFARRLEDGTLTPFNSTDRKTKALWNIASDFNRTVTCIGWWMTHPVEDVNGVMVAQTNTTAQLDTRGGKQIWKGALLNGVPGQVHPPERQNEMIEILQQTEADLPDLNERIFGAFEHPLSPLGLRLWENCQWAFRADTTYLRIAQTLAGQGPAPDLTLLYLGGPDVVSHRFWRYKEPKLFAHKPTEEQIENFGSIIEEYYIYTDQALGRLLEAYGENVTVIVISDHGFHATNVYNRFDPDDPPDDINSGHHLDAPPGIFIAAGPHIRQSSIGKPPQELARADLQTIGSVIDITPTVLAMMRIPLAADMSGQVMAGIFRDEFEVDDQPQMIATHDRRDFLLSRGQEVPRNPGDAERLRQLRSLGYIGSEDEEEEETGR